MESEEGIRVANSYKDSNIPPPTSKLRRPAPGRLREGKMAGFIYVFFFFFVAYINQRQFGELMTTAYYPSTPIIVFIGISLYLPATWFISALRFCAG